MTKEEIWNWIRVEFVRGEKSRGEIITEGRRLMLEFHQTTPLNYGIKPDPRAAERKWQVYSTALAECWLMLECVATGAQGVVKDPTKQEWCAHYTGNPKPWHDNSRVTLMQEGTK